MLVALPNNATDNKLEAIAFANVIPVEAIKPGAIRKPPPIPKKPAANPASPPIGASFHIIGSVSRMVGSPSLFRGNARSEEHTSELQSLMRISYAVLCLKKKKK